MHKTIHKVDLDYFMFNIFENNIHLFEIGKTFGIEFLLKIKTHKICKI